MKYIFIVVFSLLLFNCKNETKLATLAADNIIDKSIKVSGGDKIGNSEISFDFRSMTYYSKRNNGNYKYSRYIIKGNDSIYDELNNDRFTRIVNEQPVKLSDSLKTLYSASVNSVHYFSVLPFGLNDNAVNKTLLEEEQINNQDYYKIKVTFNQQGGGEDYEDIFVYWINKQSFKLDYLAYSYNEDDGVGMRFREAYNERFVNGLRFVDYYNYKAEDASVKLFDLGKAFSNNKLNLVSKIELENVKVKLINN